jgi:hypothetical protein
VRIVSALKADVPPSGDRQGTELEETVGMTKPTLAILTLLALSGCGTEAPPTNEQLDLVVTAREPAFQFTQPQTYALPDKVVVISDPADTSQPAQEVDPALSQHTLDLIKSEMNSRGYAPVASGAKPDLFVEVSKMNTVSAEYYYSYWPTYYGSYYGTYYGGAYGTGWAPVAYPYVSTSTVGSLVINITNPNQPNTAEQKIPTVWVAVLNGVIDSAGVPEIQLRIDSGIKQAFAQSPYLTRSSP